MKAFLLLALFVTSLPVFANHGEMRNLIELNNGTMYGGHVPAGYRSVKLESIAIKDGLKAFFTETTKEKMKSWKEFVHTSGEYSHVSVAERRVIAANPLASLEVTALLEIEEVYAIYKGNKLIGYFIQINDHVQAAIYQDGAWYDVFFDAELNLVKAFEQSA
ncbi:MAG: hypothetical protein V4598_02655 [Bdellovibrionota bacterium]